MLDSQKLKSYLDQLDPNRFSQRDKNVILVLGPTGSGKSTSINYLLGHVMEKVKIKGHMHRVIDIKQAKQKTATAKIGHSMVASETLFSSLFPVNEDFSLCDCPGFEDTRGMEERVVAAINNQLVIQQSHSIKGIVFTIDLMALSSETQRGAYFRSILSTLEAMLNNPKQQQQALYFMFTKVEDYDQDDVLDYLRETIREFNQCLDTEESTTKQSELKAQIKAAEIMLQSAKHYLFLDPVDKGKSRQQAYELFRQAPGIDKTKFKFSEQESTKKALCGYLKPITQRAITHITICQTAPKALKKCTNTIQQLEQRMAALHNRQFVIQNEKPPALDLLEQEFQRSHEAKERELSALYEKAQQIRCEDTDGLKGLNFRIVFNLVELKKFEQRAREIQQDIERSYDHFRSCQNEIISSHRQYITEQFKSVEREQREIHEAMNSAHHQAETLSEQLHQAIRDITQELSEYHLCARLLKMIPGLDSDGELYRFMTTFEKFCQQQKISLDLFQPCRLDENTFSAENILAACRM